MNSESLRIFDHPVLTFNRGPRINIVYNNRLIAAYEGETIAAALYASGIRIFSRSFKYHRPRGISCLSGHCSNCLMRVNGIPNVRTCVEPVRPGMRVESQNAWPSLEVDLASIAGYLGFLIRPGFQYKRFIRPRWFYHIWERFLRKMAGIGKLADESLDHKPRTIEIEPEIVVVGGGLAGMSAALSASKAGANVVLIERESNIGGKLRFQTQYIDIPELQDRKRGFSLVSKIAHDLELLSNCRIVKDATAFGWYDEGLLAVVRPGELWRIRPHCIIICTGSYEYPTVFENNDLPGIFLSGGAQRLMHRDGIRPGNRAVVITNDDEGYSVAKQLLEAGVSIPAIADSRRDEEVIASYGAKKISDRGIPIYLGYAIKSAVGRGVVRGVIIRSLNPPKGGKNHSKIKIACDTVCISGGRAPADELIFQRTCQGSYVLESPFQMIRKPEIVKHMEIEKDFYAAGEVTGSFGLRRAYLQGKIAGLSAAITLNHGSEDLKKHRDDIEAKLANLSRS